MKTILSTLFLVPLMFALASCNEDDGDEAPNNSPYGYDWENHVPFVATYSIFTMPVSDQFNSLPSEQGHVAMSEASGLAYSRANPGMIWSHNDSGHANIVFLLNAETGEIMARYVVQGTNNLDWEDIEVAEGPEQGKSYIYLADTGDNNEARPNYSIYRFEEPVYHPDHYGQVVQISDIPVDRIRFSFPDGSHDTEAMFVDPLTKDIFLATKRDVVSMLYVIPYPQNVEDIYQIYKAGSLGFRETSAGVSSFDGEKVMIKNRQTIFYWQRQEGESMVQMLARTPVKAPYVGEPQGEAICFDADNNYFTLSEEQNSDIQPTLFKYHFIN